MFFSFPHIAIDSEGKVGAISRPGRAGASSACGALIGALGQFQGDPSIMDAYAEGKHDPFDPEFAILKQRLAERMRKEQAAPKDMDLVSITQLAERTITSDLEALIKETVDPNVSDYAVITGVHIHNWGNEGTGAPTLEWIAPANMYIVNDGKRTTINLEARPLPCLPCKHACRRRQFVPHVGVACPALSGGRCADPQLCMQAVPALTPRQLALLQHPGKPGTVAAAFTGSTTVVESVLTDPAAGPLRAA